MNLTDLELKVLLASHKTNKSSGCDDVVDVAKKLSYEVFVILKQR